MIKRISSDRDSFKTLTFGPGLNILLADKAQGSHDRQSRNGAGKTSFVEVVHFLFGADAPPKGIFRSSALRDWTFSATVDICGKTATISRSGCKPSRIEINGPARALLNVPKGSLGFQSTAISHKNWRIELGTLLFGLPDTDAMGVKYLPTYRSMFPFFSRRQQSHGFQKPTQHTLRQQPWIEQVALSYLLGLDWRIPSSFRQLKDLERDSANLRKAVQSGPMGRHVGTAAELRTKLMVARRRVERLRARLDRFRVVPEYERFEKEADDITERINDLNHENVADRTLISELQSSIDAEDSPDFSDLERLYAESGIVLPELTRRRFTEVARFHEAVISNRRSHLVKEIASAEQRINKRDTIKIELDERRRQVMELLDSGGALEHYTRLREELGRAEAESEGLKGRLRLSERLEATRTEVDLKRTQLLKALQDDIRERDECVREAILKFEDLSEALYERAGSLTVSPTKSGPKFEVHIDAERSKGISNMQIFCFDMMLAEIRAGHNRSPGFLIHDSHLFDGVDERQIAKALQLGAERAEASGFQYIVTLNSDDMPTEVFGAGFDWRNYLVDTRLTDATESGGLFGIRFN